MAWWSVVSFGSRYDGPRGPWANVEDANDAVQRWRERKGADAGEIEAASSLRIAGPFPNRAVARHADISDYTEYLVGSP